MELLINQVGYDCDGHKIALLQTAADVEISGLVRLRRLHDDNIVIVSPDAGGVERARAYAKRLNAPLAIVDKRRDKPNQAQAMHVIGDVKGRLAIVVDDMIDTAGTLCNAANAIVEKGGATEVYACATHAVLSGPAIERIQNSAIKEVVLLDTIPVPKEKMIDKFTILPVAPTFAEAIARIYNDKPFTAAFG